MNLKMLLPLVLLLCGLKSVAETRVRNVEGDKYEIFCPDAPNGKAVVICPGGGYAMLSMQHEGREFARWLAERGCLGLVVNYRLPHGESHIPYDDACGAIRYLRANAEEFGISPKEVGIMGFSAGGHLAASVATLSDDDCRPDFQILMYPVISMRDDITHVGSKRNLLGENPTEALVERYSTENRVSRQTPAALIILSADDDVVNPENSMRYYRALLDNGISVSLHIYPSGGHGWGFNDSFRYKKEMLTELEGFIKQIKGRK